MHQGINQTARLDNPPSQPNIKTKNNLFSFLFWKTFGKTFLGKGVGGGGGGGGCSTRLIGPRPGAKFLPRTSSNEAFGETNTVRPYG
jgi:hypothetical protein